MKKIGLLILGVLVLVLMGCPTPFGYYPNEEDRVSNNETGESSPPEAVAAPFFMTRMLGSSGNYSAINGSSITFAEDQEIIIQSETTEATFYYTYTNSQTLPSDPNPQSGSTNEFSSPLVLSGSGSDLSVKVIGVKSLMYPSSISSLTASVAVGTTSTPTFNIAEGSYSSPQSLIANCSTPKSSIWYEMTTDGSEPSNPISGTSTEFTSAISLNSAGTVYRLKFLASTPDYFDSNIVELTFTISGYNVAYDANGASSGSVPVDSAEYSSGDNVTILGNTGNLDINAYGFMGWNTQANGQGTTYSKNTTMVISGDTVLYAQWAPNLLKNPSFFDGDSNWTITPGGSGTYVQATNGYDGGGRVRTSFLPGYHSQTVDLVAQGVPVSLLENKSALYTYSVWIAPVWTTCGDISLQIDLMDASDSILDSSTYSNSTLTSGWNYFSVSYTNSSSLAIRKVKVTASGEDGALFWAGYYGPMFSTENLSVNVPAQP